MKKKLIVLAMILSLAITQGVTAWATGELFVDADQQMNNYAIEQEEPVFVNIIRPLGEVITDTNLFISARIFNGAKAKLYVFKENPDLNFSAGLNLVGEAPLVEFTEELIYESELIEKRDESLFYFEESEEPIEEEIFSGIAPDAIEEPQEAKEDTEESIIAERLGEVFGRTTESGVKPFDEGTDTNVLFYYKKLENIEPGKYRIKFEIIGVDEAVIDVEEKQIEVKDFSFIIVDEEEIKKEVLDILSNSFTGIMSR
ncbi:MAG TPA: hypothetical protein VJ990_01855 [Clostridia bacterium]|nr:hypothetical protein [Clostridia bacterium]